MDAGLIGLGDVLRDPEDVCARLRSSVYGLTQVTVSKDRDLVALKLELDPWPPMAAEGYPSETVHIWVRRDGHIVAVPAQAGARTWNHLNGGIVATLCLWYPEDERALQWNWADGLEQYVTIVHRHLMGEEYFRRHGRWPWDETPHGDGPHPPPSFVTQIAARKWQES